MFIMKMSISAGASLSFENLLSLACWVKFSADDILKYFFLFFQKIGVDISGKLSLNETICMKCQILFSGKNKKYINDLSSAEFAHRVVKINHLFVYQTFNKWQDHKCLDCI